MDLSDKIKELIGDGKTQKAIDLLQEFLKERDAALLNQTYLLENQYNDLSKKLQQGLTDSSAELNRVNLALLNLVDEAEKIDPEMQFTPEIRRNTEGVIGDKTTNNALIALIILLVVVALVIFGAVKLL